MLQVASIMSTIESKKEVRALGARERMFWFMDQKHPVHLTVTAEVKGITKVQSWRDALDAVQKRHPILSKQGNLECFVKIKRSSRQNRKRSVLFVLAIAFQFMVLALLATPSEAFIQLPGESSGYITEHLFHKHVQP
jgi:hypothetical protein